MEMDDEPLLNSILANCLISDKITSYLTQRDLKLLREVSSSFDLMIRNTPSFWLQPKLHINHQTYNLPNFLSNSLAPWKLVQVDLSLSSNLTKVTSSISHILQSVHTLHLNLETLQSGQNDHNLIKFLIFLLENTPQLTNLIMSPQIFSLDLRPLLCNHHDHLLDLNSLIFNPISTKDYLSILPTFSSNILLLSYLPLKNIHTLYLKTVTPPDHLFPPKSDPNVLGYIPKLLKSLSSQLDNLTLPFDLWALTSETLNVHLPKLKCFETSCRAEDHLQLITFLRGQPMLEELTLDIRYLFHTDLVQLLEEKGSKLRKLWIRTAGFERFLRPGRSLDFSFLLRINLTSVSLNILGLKPGGNVLINFGSSLPGSLRELGIGGNYSDLLIEEKLRLVRRFRNLRKLRLKCRGFVEDRVIQEIIRGCKHLKKLEMDLGSGPELSRLGLMGIDTDGHVGGLNLGRLEDLTHLSLRADGHLSPELILEAVVLPQLRVFEYTFVPTLEEIGIGNLSQDQFIQKLLQQNPNLETVSVDFGSKLKVWRTKVPGHNLSNVRSLTNFQSR